MTKLLHLVFVLFFHSTCAFILDRGHHESINLNVSFEKFAESFPLEQAQRSLASVLQEFQKVTNNSSIPIKNIIARSSSGRKHQAGVSGYCSNSLRTSPYSPYDFCSGVVDYDFLVPTDATLASLGAAAFFFGSSVPPLFPHTCLSDFKRLVCASVYVPCVLDSGGLVETKKPCRGLCSSLWESCGPLLGTLNVAGTDCDDPAVFDPSDDPSICNDMSSTKGVQLVADNAEVYIGEVCKGITTSVYNAPTGYPVAPLLPPFVQQTVWESLLVTAEATVPVILTSDCLLAQRKLVCGSYVSCFLPICEHVFVS